MPLRKKLPATPNYVDCGHNPNELLVQKTHPLQSLSETSMTLPELKILDAYLSRINSHDEDARFVRLEKGELESLLGVTCIMKDDLSKRLDNLFQAITIRDKNKPKGFIKIGLFEKAICEQDDDGLWQIELACSASAMQYIFNPENLGYFKYRLHNVVNLTSRYSYVLYLYLVDNKFRKPLEVSVDKLKALLNCVAVRYTQFKFFNAEILKKCRKELNEKTDIKLDYEILNTKKQLLKPRQKAAYIRFLIETNSDIDENQLTLDDMPEPDKQPSDLIQLLSEACKGEFTATELEELVQHIVVKDLPMHTYGINIARYHYIAQLYAKLCRQAERNPIPNRLSYLIKIIDND